MKLLSIQHMACPIHNAGGETTVHAALRAMVNRGHEVKVICRPHTEERQFDDYVFEGVEVFRCPLRGDQQWIKDFALDFDPDLLLTHLDLTTMTMQLAVDIHKPLAHFFHNTFSIPVFKVIPSKCALAIFNSNWVSEESEWQARIDRHMQDERSDGFRPRQIIIHPVVEPELYRCQPGTKITLINPTPGKGADTFYGVSKLLPEYEFLTVKSVYGEQIAVPHISAHLHPNVETMEHVSDARDYLTKTKIILMPSEYESFGRTAVEAACSGIPSIVHPTPGLKEALGDAAIYCDRNDFQSWANAIQRLMTDEVYYRSRSDAALKLANGLNPESEFDRLEEALLLTGRDWTRGREDDISAKMWTTDRRIYKRADGTLTDNKAEAQSLYRAEGNLMPLDEAIQFGFVSRPAVTVTPGMNTDDLTGGKMVDGPQENKAISEPDENKGRAKKSKAA